MPTTTQEAAHRNNPAANYLYAYACHEDEQELCRLELRTLLGCEPDSGGFIVSPREVDPSRSPFVKWRLEVLFEGGSVEEIAEQAAVLELDGATFKVVCIDTAELDDYAEQRAVERAVGARIRGRADMRRPERLFGIAKAAGRWLLGAAHKSEAVWLRHQSKPQNYSTALGTRVARAIANIAVPDPRGVRAIDPCCGIGTVLVEAMSMGIDIVGRDLNPLAVRGARTNLSHFGMPQPVAIQDMRHIDETYDAAILDMPYNLCSKLSEAEQLSMLQSARRMASRAVIVSTEPIEAALAEAGFRMVDRCIVRKGAFARQIIVCE